MGVVSDEILPGRLGKHTRSREVMAANPRSRLGEMLVAEGLITPAQLDDALDMSSTEGTFVGQALVDLEYLEREQLVSTLIRQCRIPHINLADYDISREIAALVPREICQTHRIIPVDRLGDMLTLAMVDPLDDTALEAVGKYCDLKVKPILCSWYDLEQVFHRLFGDPSLQPPPPAGLPQEPSLEQDDLPASSELAVPESGDESGGGPELDPSSPASLRDLISVSRETPSGGDAALSEALETDGSQDARREAVKAALLGRGEQRPEPDSEVSSAARTRRSPKRPPGRRPARPAMRGTRSRGSNGHATSEYTFDTFVPSSANEFAYQLAQAVARAPGTTANPFFLYGDVGLGKTHLLISIVNDIVAQHKDLHLVFVPSSEFGQELVDAIETNRLNEFRAKYMTGDAVMMDDIQFLVGRDRAQEEFFTIFNHLLDRGRQIVLAADKHPEELHKIERRLVSRFVGGIVAGLKPPDWDTRIAILRERLKQADVNVTELIATHVPDDVRKLIGALRKIVAYCTLVKRDITVDVAQEVLCHLHYTPFE